MFTLTSTPKKKKTAFDLPDLNVARLDYSYCCVRRDFAGADALNVTAKGYILCLKNTPPYCDDNIVKS